MAYSELLAGRLRELLGGDFAFEERKMFGGLAFMLNGNMCVGVIDDVLVLRLGEERAGEALKKPNTKPMDFTGKPMKTMVFILPEGIKTEENLQQWVQKAVDFVITLKQK